MPMQREQQRGDQRREAEPLIRAFTQRKHAREIKRRADDDEQDRAGQPSSAAKPEPVALRMQRR